jgi:DNA-binding NtrC family response regulator
MLFVDSTVEKAQDLKILQEVSQLDEEVRLIMVSGYKSELAQRAKERFVLKPFMLKELFQPVRAGTSGVGQG